MGTRVELKEMPAIKDTLLIVDFLSMYYRGAHVHSGLQYEGEDTGGLFGMVKMLSNTIDRTKATDVIVCADSKPYLRTLEYPEYKSKRSSNKTEAEIKSMMRDQKNCEGLINTLAIPFLEKKGLEADDLIALLIKRLHKKYNKIVIASGDSDLYQLFVFPNVVLYQGAEKGFYTPEDFKNEYPQLKSPAQWNDVLAYSGGHNGLEGIKGIGIKTGIKIVIGAPLSEKIRGDVKDNKKNTARNIKLGRLPFYRLKKYDPVIHSASNYNERALIRYLSCYGITLTQAMSDNFISIHK